MAGFFRPIDWHYSLIIQCAMLFGLIIFFLITPRRFIDIFPDGILSADDSATFEQLEECCEEEEEDGMEFNQQTKEEEVVVRTARSVEIISGKVTMEEHVGDGEIPTPCTTTTTISAHGGGHPTTIAISPANCETTAPSPAGFMSTGHHSISSAVHLPSSPTSSPCARRHPSTPSSPTDQHEFCPHPPSLAQIQERPQRRPLAYEEEEEDGASAAAGPLQFVCASTIAPSADSPLQPADGMATHDSTDTTSNDVVSNYISIGELVLSTHPTSSSTRRDSTSTGALSHESTSPLLLPIASVPCIDVPPPATAQQLPPPATEQQLPPLCKKSSSASSLSPFDPALLQQRRRTQFSSCSALHSRNSDTSAATAAPSPCTSRSQSIVSSAGHHHSARHCHNKLAVAAQQDRHFARHISQAFKVSRADCSRPRVSSPPCKPSHVLPPTPRPSPSSSPPSRLDCCVMPPIHGITVLTPQGESLSPIASTVSSQPPATCDDAFHPPPLHKQRRRCSAPMAPLPSTAASAVSGAPSVAKEATGSTPHHFPTFLSLAPQSSALEALQFAAAENDPLEIHRAMMSTGEEEEGGGGMEDEEEGQQVARKQPLQRKKTGTRESIKRLLKNPIYLTVTVTLCALFFIVTGIQFWATRYFEEILGAPTQVVLPVFCATAATGPMLGVLAGGVFVDWCGGYKTKLGMFRSLSICSCLGALATVMGVAASMTTNFAASIACIWLILFFGAAILPPATGIIIAAVDADIRAFASGFSMTVYNIFGYTLGTLLPGALMSQIGLQGGMIVVFNWSFIGLVGIAIATIIAWQLKFAPAIITSPPRFSSTRFSSGDMDESALVVPSEEDVELTPVLEQHSSAYCVRS
eukprot:GHVS01012663.1.p1 GENE.GHVS01012663.1~~GHVS01012663.1.p1  ORF type:complete len:866 (-),score=214.69 GHVS01012663.1:875-3472(-)